MTIMKRFAKLHFSLLTISGILFLFLTGCGVRGGLYLPPVSPAPVKPSQPEPVGIQYPIPNTSSDNNLNKP
jgi:predicted small lipoprotein YifL